MLDFLGHLGALIRAALGLTPNLLQTALSYPHSNWLIFGVAMLAGASTLVGRSVILFANRVTRGRFALSLALNGLLDIGDLVFWAVSIWLVAMWRYDVPISLRDTVKIVCLGSAPFVLGFTMLAPYLGQPIGWALRVWSVLIMLRAVDDAFALTLWQALWCVIWGWVFVQVVSVIVGQPFTALRNRVWQAVTGTAYDQDTQDLVDDVIQQLSRQLPARG